MRRPTFLFALLLAAACTGGADDDAATLPPDSLQPPRLAPGDTLGAEAREVETALDVVTMAPLLAPAAATADSSRSPHGRVRVFRMAMGGDSALQLTVEANSLEPGPHAWHLHDGKCDRAGAPVALALSDAGDRAGVAGPLTAAGDGVAESSVLIPPAQLTPERLRDRPLSLRIHAGADAASPVVACADL